MFRIMSDAKVELVYKGDAVDQGSMDVHLLAPALLAFGDACQEANRILNGEQATLTVKVQSDFRTGSFEVLLEIAQTLIDHTRHLFRGDTVSAADVLTYLGFFGLSVPGLLQFWQFLQGERPQSTTTLDNGGVQITKVSKSTLIIAPEVVKLDSSRRLREVTPLVAKPLEHAGFNKLEIRRDKKTLVASIEKDQLSYLMEPASLTGDPVNEPLTDTTIDAVFQIIRPSFQNRYTWNLSDGNRVLSLRIDDLDFLSKVDNREITFGAGDLLEVLLNTKTFRTPESKLKTDQTIVRVKNVRPASPKATQTSLFPVADTEEEKKKK